MKTTAKLSLFSGRPPRKIVSSALVAVLVFVGMTFQTVISLNALVFYAFFLGNTPSGIPLIAIPYWAWVSLTYSEGVWWGLWTLPILIFLSFPFIWALFLALAFRVRSLWTPFCVQLGSVSFDVLLLTGIVLQEYVTFSGSSLIPSPIFWQFVANAITSLVIYGFLFGLIYAILLKLVFAIAHQFYFHRQWLTSIQLGPTATFQSVRHSFEIRRIRRFLVRKRLKNISRGFLRAVFYVYVFSAIVVLGYLSLTYGSQLNLLDLKLFLTLWVAEVPIAVLLRYMLGEGRRGRPRLGFGFAENTRESDNVVYHELVVTNEGEHGAQDCEALLELKIERDDVIDLPNAVITKKTFRQIELDNLYWQDEGAEFSIKANDYSTLEVLRLVKESGSRPPRLEIPSGKGWKKPLVGLKVHDYTGSVNLVSMNCHHHRLEFDILFNAKDGTIRLDY
jgi:hypothetical protein